MAIADLVEADRQLALTLIEDAEATPAQDPENQDEVDELIEEARDELAKGDSERDADKPDEAIDRYRKAWERACEAIQLASEGANEPPVAVDDTEETDNDTILVVAAPGVLGNDTDPNSDPLTVSAFDTVSALGADAAVASDGSFTYDPTVSAPLQALGAGDSIDDTFTYTAADGQGGFDTAVVTVTVHGPGVVTVSARTLKLESLEDLAEHIDESSRFEKAIREIEDSLDEELWIDDDHLDKERGHRVFSEERHAVKELMALLDRRNEGGDGDSDDDDSDDDDSDDDDSDDDTGTGSGGGAGSGDDDTQTGAGSEISEEAFEWAEMAIDNLVAADRQLALTLIEEAEAAPVSDPSKQDKVDEELEKAREELAKGDAERDAGEPDKAIQHYRKAWEHAGHALRFADDGSVSAAGNAFSVNPGATLSVGGPGLLENDADVNDGPLTASLIDGPEHGDLDLAPDGSFTYSPDPEFEGTDGFTYAATNGDGESDDAVVVINVEADEDDEVANEPPVAGDDAFETDEDTAVVVAAPGLFANDEDADGDELTVTSFDAVSALGATVAVAADGSFTYDPTAAEQLQALAEGDSVEDTFTYTIGDGNEGADTATVAVTVSGLAEAPSLVANDDSHAVTADTILAVDAPGVLANDEDADGDELTVTTFDAVSALGATVAVAADGSFTYDPTAAEQLQALAEGDLVEDTFTYSVSDGSDDDALATVRVMVTGGAPLNAAPVAVDDGYEAANDNVLGFEAPGVLANDEDADGDELTVTSFDAVSALGATVAVASDGSFTYDPTAAEELQALAEGDLVEDTFTYSVSDGSGDDALATVRVMVTGAAPLNAAPVAVDDGYEAANDSVLGIEAPGVLANDEDADGDELTVASFDAVSALGATVAVASDGSFTYDPTAAEQLQALAEGDLVEDTFTYSVSDGSGDDALATVHAMVTGAAPLNAAPVAVDDGYEAANDTVLVVDAPGVLANDEDPDGGDLAVASFDAVSALGATVAVAADGSFTYDPTDAEELQALAEGDAVADTFTYVATDGVDPSNVATVTLTVTASGGPPETVLNLDFLPGIIGIDDIVGLDPGDIAGLGLRNRVGGGGVPSAEEFDIAELLPGGWGSPTEWLIPLAGGAFRAVSAQRDEDFWIRQLEQAMGLSPESSPPAAFGSVDVFRPRNAALPSRRLSMETALLDPQRARAGSPENDPLDG